MTILFRSCACAQNKILVRFRGSFQKFPMITPVTFIWESSPPPPPGGGGGIHQKATLYVCIVSKFNYRNDEILYNSVETGLDISGYYCSYDVP